MSVQAGAGGSGGSARVQRVGRADALFNCTAIKIAMTIVVGNLVVADMSFFEVLLLL